MSWPHILYIIILLVSAIGFSFLTLYTWQKRSTLQMRYYGLCMAMAAGLSTAYLFSHLSQSPDVVFFWVRLRFLFLAGLPAAALFFVLAYLGYDRWLNWRFIGALLILPAMTQFVVWIFPQWFWSDWTVVQADLLTLEVPRYASWFGVYAAYSYVLSGVVLVLLARYALRGAAPYRGQSAWILAGWVIGLLTTLVNIFINNDAQPTLNPTPIGVAVFGLTATWAILRHHFLDLTPVAYDRVVNTLPNAVFVTNEEGIILQLNRSAEILMNSTSPAVVGKRLIDLLPELGNHIDILASAKEQRGEITVAQEGKIRDYNFTQSPLRRRGEFIGSVLMLSDMTEQKNAVLMVQRQHEFLSALYDIVLDLLTRTEMDDLLQTIVEQGMHILDAPYVRIMLKEDEEFVTYAFSPMMAFIKGDRGRRGDAILAWQAHDSRRPVIVEDYAQWPARREIFDGVEIHATANLPIVFEDVCIGILQIARAKPNHPFTLEQVDQAMMFSQLAALTIRKAQQQELSRRLAADEERQRLARDLHDSVTQTLFAASVTAQTLPRIWEKDPQTIRQGLDDLNRLTRGALAEMRTLLVELRPTALGEADLSELLTSLVDAFRGQNHVEAEFECIGEAVLTPKVQVIVYRIAQEALNNIAKHARAKRVNMHFERGEGQCALTISDNGRGFAQALVPVDHFGLEIMHERAAEIGGQLEIESQPGTGTTIRFTWKQEQPDSLN